MLGPLQCFTTRGKRPSIIYIIWRFPKISKIAPVFSIINKPSSYGGTSISGNPQIKVQQWIGRTDRSSDAKASTARLAASSVPPQDFVMGGMHPVWGDQQQNTAFLCYSWNMWEYSGHWIDLISWKNWFFPHHRFNCNVPSINQNNPIKSGWNSALIGIDLDWTKIIQIYCVLYLHVPTMGRVNQAKWCV